jgi:hypothetical protein
MKKALTLSSSAIPCQKNPNILAVYEEVLTK